MTKEIKIFKHRPEVTWLIVFILSLIVSQSGCYLHSDAQEELANDIFTRYKLINPAGDTVLENLDSDLNKLLDAQKKNTDLLTKTSARSTVGMTWQAIITEAEDLQSEMNDRYQDNKDEIKKINDLDAALAKRKGGLEKSLKDMDKALEKLKGERSLAARLQMARKIISVTTASIKQIAAPAAGTPFDARVKSSIQEVIKYLDSLDGDEAKTEKTFSLLLESLQLGRDIVSLQIDSIEVQEGHNQRMLSILKAEEKLLVQRDDITAYLVVFRTAPPKQTVAQYIHDLSVSAHSSPVSEDNLKKLLDILGKFQTARITADSRLGELDVRRQVEIYRRARLLDSAYERQRIVLISTGLDGVVRYSESGWRREDITRVTGIFSTVAQIVIAVR